MKTRLRCLQWVVFFPALLMLLLASFGLQAQEIEPANSPRPGAGFPVAVPESQGLSTAALDALADVVQSYFEEDLIVGAELLVIKNRHTVLHEVFGWRDRELEISMTRDTIFNIRSMTKPLTGASIQMLLDQGDLKLVDRASQYITGFDNIESNAITIEQLLTHRSGLPLTVFTIGPRQYDDLLAIANAAGEQGPQFPPSSKFWYSDAGSDVLGAIVEHASGLPLEEFWSQNLLEPLGMHDTFAAIDKIDREAETRWDRLASVYLARKLAGGEGWVPFWKPAAQPLYPFAWGSQTLYSTPMDYARFLAMWMDDGKVEEERILSSEAIARTLSPVSEMNGLGSDERSPTGFSGLSTFYGQMSVLYMRSDGSGEAKPVVIGHSGSDGTWAWAWPELDLMVLYFTQSRGQATGLDLEFRIDRLLLQPESSRARPETGTHREHSSIVGEWEGTIVIDGRSVQDVLWRFELLASGEAVGFMGPAAQRIAFIPMQDITVVGGELKFKVDSQNGNYRGQISKDNVSGTWYQGRSLPLDMTRSSHDERQDSSKPSEEATAPILGEWKGTIGGADAPAQDIVWRFELSDTGELVGFMGPAARGIATIPMQDIMMRDSELSFSVDSQGGRYEGHISEDGVVGTWSQGRSASLSMDRKTADK